MTRRFFLRGIIAAGVVASVPASVIKAVAGPTESNRWALDKLQAAWVAYFKQHKKVPYEFRVGEEFFNMLVSELKACERFVEKGYSHCDTTKFKNTTVIIDGKGYGIKAIR